MIQGACTYKEANANSMCSFNFLLKFLTMSFNSLLFHIFIMRLKQINPSNSLHLTSQSVTIGVVFKFSYEHKVALNLSNVTLKLFLCHSPISFPKERRGSVRDEETLRCLCIIIQPVSAQIIFVVTLKQF